LRQVTKKFWTTGRIRHWADLGAGPVATVLLSVAAMAQAPSLSSNNGSTDFRHEPIHPD